MGSPIQLEQVLINMLTNARDALADAPRKVICITCAVRQGMVLLTFRDTGHGIPPGMAWPCWRRSGSCGLIPRRC
jgi:C4-dicarboxylate-specific signal transduction histidine kinase